MRSDDPGFLNSFYEAIVAAHLSIFAPVALLHTLYTREVLELSQQLKRRLTSLFRVCRISHKINFTMRKNEAGHKEAASSKEQFLSDQALAGILMENILMVEEH